MANYQFTADLVDDILFRAGEAVDGSSDFEAVALTYINRAYQSLWMGGGEFLDGNNQNWWWLRKDPPGTLILTTSISDGTVNVTNNSASITFSSAPAISVAGYFFRTVGGKDTFRILTHTAASTSATLDSVYTETTNAAASYKLMKAEYTLASDVLRVISPMRCRSNISFSVEGVDINSLERDWPLSLLSNGVPTLFAHVGEQKVRFNRFGSDTANDLVRLEYDYLYRPAVLTNSTSEEPAVPWQYRHILCDMALTYLFADKNDDRIQISAQAAKAGLMAMVNENKRRWLAQSKRMGRIRARLEKTETYERTLRTESGFIIG